MYTYAHIKNNEVVNLIVWDGTEELQLEGELILADEHTYIGGRYDNGFIPPEPVPLTAEELEYEATVQATIDKLSALGFTSLEIEILL